jgi:hypothetical protein
MRPLQTLDELPAVTFLEDISSTKRSCLTPHYSADGLFELVLHPQVEKYDSLESL